MKDSAAFINGYRKCCLYSALSGVINLGLCLIPSLHTNAGVGIGMLAFAATAYVLSRIGVVP